MDTSNIHHTLSEDYSVSPYLQRPLRSYAQAMADIEARRRPDNTVTPFIPKLVYSNEDEQEATVAA